MTRIDLTTRELHDLITPVLPHTGTDPDVPELALIRLEVRAQVLYAIATDRYTFAGEARGRLPAPRVRRGLPEGLLRPSGRSRVRGARL